MSDSMVIGLDQLWPDCYARAALEKLGDPNSEAHRNVRSSFMAVLWMARDYGHWLHEGAFEVEREGIEHMMTLMQGWSKRVGATQLEHRCAEILEALPSEENDNIRQRVLRFFEDCGYNYDALDALA